ncbi:MAG TPA: DNA-processing protein DprA [Thermodesulfovibrionales bacterium]|nr:DNA-processing protein DprA [Thermodesulfovibrionales bacterium]
MSHLESWIALSLVPEIGTVTFRKLLSLYGEPEDVFRASLKELSSIDGIGERKAKNIKDFSGFKEAAKCLALLNRSGARVVTCKDPDYPDLLRQVENGPVLLYVRGSMREEDRFAVAIVGSRKPTHYGRVVTEKLSSELAGAGFTVVSGMARGIDTIAHVGSLTSGGRTVAVLGSGIDTAYPPENRGLMEKIAESGYVVSEFPLGTKPNRENFPIRNRLISGLSLGVLVVEATRESGSLITAQHALEQNREVFAVPGSITSPNSSGTNDLIRRGAKLIERTEDIVEELGPMLKGFVPAREKSRADMTDEERRLCDILTGEPLHIDVISRGLTLSPSRVLATLLNLELKGIVRQTEGKRFYLIQ